MILDSKIISFWKVKDILLHMKTHTDIRYGLLNNVLNLPGKQKLPSDVDESLDHSRRGQPSCTLVFMGLDFLAQMVHSSYPWIIPQQQFDLIFILDHEKIKC